jgi:hypothetical protein
MHAETALPSPYPAGGNAIQPPQASRSRKRRAAVLLAACVVCVLGASPMRTPAAESPHHSLNEYAYLVGSWKCVAKSPGKPAYSYATSMRWMYPDHSVIDQSIVVGANRADFILTYDHASDAFKGIFVEDPGGVGVWENPGPVAGGWTEIGYDFKGDNLVPATRAKFHDVTPRHYAFDFWKIASKQDPGQVIESDECNKV